VVQNYSFFLKSKVYIKKITYQYVLKSGFLFCFQKSNYFAITLLRQLMHIAIAGNIGAGKTSLTELVSKHYGWEAHFEDVIDNPYLDDFYNHMERWSFNLQVYFLKSRFQQLLSFKNNKKTIVQDRTIYEDAYIFAPNLNAMGLMNQRDFKNYRELFDLVESLIDGPDLLIYLRSSIPNLVSKIHKRGRDYENSISIDYLSRLNERYEAWISTYDETKMIIIDVDGLDFVENKEDFSAVIAQIDKGLSKIT
jgi:deoxyadenosine/deoxycytidine kinase